MYSLVDVVTDKLIYSYAYKIDQLFNLNLHCTNSQQN